MEIQSKNKIKNIIKNYLQVENNVLIYRYKNGGFIVKDYKDFDNDIDYMGGVMDFPYKRITERDKEYWSTILTIRHILLYM